MFRLYQPLFTQPVINARLFVASLFIHLLGLAPAFYAMLIFARYLSHGLDATLVTLTAGTLLAMGLELALRKVRFRMMGALTAREERRRVEQVATRLLQARLDALQALDPARRGGVQRLLEQVQQAMAPAQVLAWMDAPFALLFLLVLALMAWPLGVAALLIAAAAVGYVYFQAHGLRGVTRNLQRAQQGQQPLLASVERIEAVRVANAGPALAERWARQNGDTRVLRFSAARLQERLQSGTHTATGLMSVVVIGVGAKLTTAGLLDIGSLFGASILATRLLALIARPAQQIATLLQAQQAVQELEPVLALAAESGKGTRLPAYSGRLEFKDLAFAYPGAVAPLFEGLNLSIAPGSMVVVTGGNGTGKSTLGRVIAGLLEPVRGSVLADGVDLRQCVPHWWRRQLVYVPQEPEFLDGTLRENLQWLTPQLPPEQMLHLLQRVGLKRYVDQHPQGLDMPLPQGGRLLSPGQRRRLAMARALATGGRLVLMDEPNEGMDVEGIAAVNDILNALRQDGCTLILCSQSPAQEFLRRATVINLDAKPVPKVSRPGGL